MVLRTQNDIKISKGIQFSYGASIVASDKLILSEFCTLYLIMDFPKSAFCNVHKIVSLCLPLSDDVNLARRESHLFDGRRTEWIEEPSLRLILMVPCLKGQASIRRRHWMYY